LSGAGDRGRNGTTPAAEFHDAHPTEALNNSSSSSLNLLAVDKQQNSVFPPPALNNALLPSF